MTNVSRIESFIKKIILAHGRDPSNPEEPATIKMQSLMIVIKDMAQRVGDDKMNDFFRNVLNSLVTGTVEGPMKNMYMLTLNQFNQELNQLLN